MDLNKRLNVSLFSLGNIAAFEVMLFPKLTELQITAAPLMFYTGRTVLSVLSHRTAPHLISSHSPSVSLLSARGCVCHMGHETMLSAR